jgi:hypothetical protein
MELQIILSFVSGTVFILLLFIMGIIIYLREKDVPESAMFIFRSVLSLGGAAFAAILTGFINVSIQHGEVFLKAGGALAVFVVLFKVNPPKIIESKKKP